MRKCLLALAISVSAGSCFADAMPNYWSGNISMGLGWSSLAHTDEVDMGGGVYNQYITSSSNSAQPIEGVGLSYNMPYPDVTLGLGLSAYHMNSAQVSGTGTVLSNGGGLGDFPYTASGQSYALMFEPKFTWTRYALQPYVFGGAGVALNDYGNYWSGSAGQITMRPFTSRDEYSFAYEMGVGVQYAFDLKGYHPVVALDYRYINWGNAGLSGAVTADGGLSPGSPSFGNIKTNAANLSLIFPF